MIEIIFLDVDGCLSDGGIYRSVQFELKRFDVKDGFAIEQWHRLGKLSAILTGKTSPIVANRAKELGIKYCFEGVKDKFSKAKEILDLEGLEWKNASAIGDDLNDMKLLSSVGFSFSPLDCHKSIKTDIRLSQKGGFGAVREMIDILVEKENLTDEWIRPWL